MTPRIVRQWLTRVGLVGGAALVLAGCPEDAAEITEQASEPSFDFPVASAFVEPEGVVSVDNLVLAQVDPAITDAFGRQISFLTPAASFFTCGGPCPAWEFPIRNSTEDPRLPAIVDDDAAGLIAITPDSIFGLPFLVFTFADLEPDTDYTITLERLGLTVDQGLDHTNVLLNDPFYDPFGVRTMPDNPDALASLGGTEGTTLGSNPYIIFQFTTDGTGASGFLFGGFDGGGTNDVIETNSLASFAGTQYNYLVVHEGTDASGPVAMRAQVGVDVDGSSAAINNALAPFPQASISPAAMLAAPGGAGRPDSLSVRFSNLEELAGGAAYEAWLVNDLTGSMTPAVGTYNRFQIVLEIDPVTGEILSSTDSLVETVSGVSSFVGGDAGDGFRHELIVGDGSLAPDTLGVHQFLVLTLASSPGGSLPAARPFWFQYTDQNGTADNFFDDAFNTSGTTIFGNFEPANSANSRAYIGTGQGTGGVRALERDAETGLVTSGLLSVDLQALSRPPMGYVLQGWVVSEDGSQVFPTDPITGPPPEFVSITTADEELIEGIVTPNGVLAANFRLNSAEAGISFSDFFSFMVTLEPKLGIPGMGPIPVQAGVLPEQATTPVGNGGE